MVYTVLFSFTCFWHYDYCFHKTLIRLEILPVNSICSLSFVLQKKKSPFFGLSKAISVLFGFLELLVCFIGVV